MQNKPDKVDLLKYWLDSEITIIHIYLAVLAIFIINNVFFTIAAVIYCVWSFIYSLVRMAYIAKHDPEFLKVKWK